MEETVGMTQKEIERIKVLAQVREGHLTQISAAKRLGISERQIRKLLRRVESIGDRAIISKKRGRPSNRCLPSYFKVKVLTLVRQHYIDFGPKLANEYLKNKHSISISKETLRRWMIEEHLWIPRKKNNKRLHPSRERRRVFGELVQVDGSHHAWFEGRSPPCVLMVFIDDATSLITSLHFAEEENLEAYFYGFSKHLDNYGIPLALYGDRCSILIPRRQPTAENITQFHKALRELKCELLLARSPQAKGRVERANRTLQDRLVKMLRVKGVNHIEEANEVLEEYRKEHNRLFSKKPSEQSNAHRSLEGICLENIMTIRETRTLCKDFTVQFENRFYKISSQDHKVKLFKGGKIEIRKQLNGKRIAFFCGKQVQMTLANEIAPPLLDSKQIIHWTPRKKYIPPVTHSYKKKFFMDKVQREMCLNVV